MGRRQRREKQCLQAATSVEPRPVVMWKLADVVGVYACTFAGGVFGYILGRSVAEEAWVAFMLTRYIVGLLGLCVPIGYIWKRYGLSEAALGLKSGKLRLRTSLGLGIGVAVAYFLLVRIYLFRNPIGLSASPLFVVFTSVLVVLSLNGFAAIVLAPLSEEVLHRGFLYGYLRTRLGRWPSLILQAALFSALHLGPWSYSHFFHFSNLILVIDIFLIGLVLGFLYETTNSLYPSIACHATVNYLAMIYPAFSHGT